MKTIIATGIAISTMLIAAPAGTAGKDPVHSGAQVDRIPPGAAVAYTCDRFECFADIHIRMHGRFRQMYTEADFKYRHDRYEAAGRTVQVMTTSDRTTRVLDNVTGKAVLYNPGFDCPSR